MERKKRRVGALLHPTSLFGWEGIGTLGKAAYEFADFLNLAGLTAWQILPLTPLNYEESSYSCLSAFAGNTFLIDLELLAEQGYLSLGDIIFLHSLSRCS